MNFSENIARMCCGASAVTMTVKSDEGTDDDLDIPLAVGSKLGPCKVVEVLEMVEIIVPGEAS